MIHPLNAAFRKADPRVLRFSHRSSELQRSGREKGHVWFSHMENVLGGERKKRQNNHIFLITSSQEEGPNKSSLSAPQPDPHQVCVLYQQMKKEYGSNVVPAFPPKKIFTLTPAEVEQRREQLEKYMQAGRVLAGPSQTAPPAFGPRLRACVCQDSVLLAGGLRCA